MVAQTQTYNPVGWFEIPTSDLARAKKFYEAVLDVTLHEEKMNDYTLAMFPMEPGVIGAAGALVSGANFMPSCNGTLVYFTAPDLDATLKKVEANGGRIIKGKHSIGQYGFVAFIEDTEANRVALHSRS